MSEAQNPYLNSVEKNTVVTPFSLGTSCINIKLHMRETRVVVINISEQQATIKKSMKL